MLWLLNMGFAAGGAAAPTPTPSPAAPTGAGRPRRSRRRYTLRIDGRLFEAQDEEQALQILAQVRSLAEVAAQRKADDVVERALPKAVQLGKAKPIRLKTPTVQVSQELRAAASEAQAAIDRAYANASAAAEMRLLLALAELASLAEDEDEEELLLLH